MRKFTKRELQAAAQEGEGFCRRCGAQGPVEREEDDGEGLYLPCESCGALGMMPAEGLLAVLEMIDLGEDGL